MNWFKKAKKRSQDDLFDHSGDLKDACRILVKKEMDRNNWFRKTLKLADVDSIRKQLSMWGQKSGLSPEQIASIINQVSTEEQSFPFNGPDDKRFTQSIWARQRFKDLLSQNLGISKGPAAPREDPLTRRAKGVNNKYWEWISQQMGNGVESFDQSVFEFFDANNVDPIQSNMSYRDAIVQSKMSQFDDIESKSDPYIQSLDRSERVGDMYMVEVDPKDQMTEGKNMQNCIGDQCMVSHESRIFSLRDKNNSPHVSIQVQPDEDYSMEDDFWEITQIRGKQNSNVSDKYVPYVIEWIKNNPDLGISETDNLPVSDEDFWTVIEPRLNLPAAKASEYLSRGYADKFTELYHQSDEKHKKAIERTILNDSIYKNNLDMFDFAMSMNANKQIPTYMLPQVGQFCSIEMIKKVISIVESTGQMDRNASSGLARGAVWSKDANKLKQVLSMVDMGDSNLAEMYEQIISFGSISMIGILPQPENEESLLKNIHKAIKHNNIDLAKELIRTVDIVKYPNVPKSLTIDMYLLAASLDEVEVMRSIDQKAKEANVQIDSQGRYSAAKDTLTYGAYNAFKYIMSSTKFSLDHMMNFVNTLSFERRSDPRMYLILADNLQGHPLAIEELFMSAANANKYDLVDLFIDHYEVQGIGDALIAAAFRDNAEFVQKILEKGFSDVPTIQKAFQEAVEGASQNVIDLLGRDDRISKADIINSKKSTN